MSNDVTIVGDGWNDAAAEASARVIRGQLLKFADWNWTYGKESEALEKGTRLVAIGTAAAWVKWKDGKPTEYRMRASGKPLPEREELGDTDETKWEFGPDQKTRRDPWQATRFIYLVHPGTGEAYTFSTSSFGGREAVINLADSIARVRSAGHAGAVPVVALEAAAMMTRFGRKSKPVLKIVEWKPGGPEREALSPPPEELEIPY